MKNNLSTLLLALGTSAALLLSSCSKKGGEPSTDVAQDSATTTVSQAAVQQADTMGSPAPASQQPAAAGDSRKLIRVATLNTPEAYTEFQRNVQLVQAQRQNIINLNAQKQQTQDAAQQAAIQAQIDTALAKLNENNQKMVQAYGFSLTRNYTVVIEKSQLYVGVTDEEAARVETQQGQ